MGAQGRLFKASQDDVERMANLVVMLDLEIINLQAELKDAQKELRESAAADVVADIKAQIKDAKSRHAKAQAELRATALEAL